MTRLTRDKKGTGDYYTADGKYHIEKVNNYWNVYEKVDRNTWTQWQYIFSCDTLKEVRESL